MRKWLIAALLVVGLAGTAEAASFVVDMPIMGGSGTVPYTYGRLPFEFHWMGGPTPFYGTGWQRTRADETAYPCVDLRGVTSFRMFVAGSYYDNVGYQPNGYALRLGYIVNDGDERDRQPYRGVKPFGGAQAFVKVDVQGSVPRPPSIKFAVPLELRLPAVCLFLYWTPLPLSPVWPEMIGGPELFNLKLQFFY